jgi:hypothetical protein
VQVTISPGINRQSYCLLLDCRSINNSRGHQGLDGDPGLSERGMKNEAPL